jgi:hypothetical protein
MIQDTQQYEAWHGDDKTRDTWVGAYATEAEAHRALAAIAQDAACGHNKRNPLSFTRASQPTSLRSSSVAALPSASLLQPTKTWLFGIPGAEGGGKPSRRRRQQQQRQKQARPDRSASAMETFGAKHDSEMDELKMELSWVLAGEMPELSSFGGGAASISEEDIRSLEAARSLVDTQRQALQEKKRAAAEAASAARREKAAARRQRREARAREQAAAAARAAHDARVRPAVRRVLEAAWLDHRSSGYRLERTVGEDGWTQEREDTFASTVASQLELGGGGGGGGSSWRGYYAPQHGWEMWPAVIPAAEMAPMLGALAAAAAATGGGDGDAAPSAADEIVEAWLREADEGQAQLQASLSAVKYRAGVMESMSAESAVAEACLVLHLPKPAAGVPLRRSVDALATKLGVTRPTTPLVPASAIEAARAEGGLARAVLRLYEHQGQQQQPAGAGGGGHYVLRDPPAAAEAAGGGGGVEGGVVPPPTAAQRRARAVEASDSWWREDFLLGRAALRWAACAVAAEAGQGEGDELTSSVPAVARFFLHQPDSEAATECCVRQALKADPSMAMAAEGIRWSWVSEYTREISAGLRAERRQRQLASSVSSTLAAAGTARGAGPASSPSVAPAAVGFTPTEAEPIASEEIVRCTDRLRILEAEELRARDSSDDSVLAAAAAARPPPPPRQYASSSSSKVRLRNRVKLMATRAAWRLELTLHSGQQEQQRRRSRGWEAGRRRQQQQLRECVADCSAALEHAALAERTASLDRAWGTLCLQLRARAHERLQRYELSTQDAAAAFARQPDDPTTPAATLESWLFETESQLRWPQLAEAARPPRVRASVMEPRKQPRRSRMEFLVASQKQLSHVPGRAAAAAAASPLPPSQMVGVSAEWLLEWSEANGLCGASDWFLDSGRGRRVAAAVPARVKGGCSAAVARRATALALAEGGLHQPLSTAMVEHVAAFTNRSQKTGAVDLSRPASAPSSSVAGVISDVVAASTKLLPDNTSFAAAFLQSSAEEAAAHVGVGVGAATHVVVYARGGMWWSLVQALLVHTLGWLPGTRARSESSAELRRQLRKHRAESESTNQPVPLYWLDFLSLPQHTASAAMKAADGLGVWERACCTCGRAVAVVGEASDVASSSSCSPPPPPPLLLSRRWCWAELLLAAAQRAQIEVALSFASLQALAERLGRLGPATPRPAVSAELAEVWAGWYDQPSLSFAATRCKVGADASALQALVQASPGLNVAERKLRALLRAACEPLTEGLLAHFTQEGCL